MFRRLRVDVLLTYAAIAVFLYGFWQGVFALAQAALWWAR